MLRRRIPGYLHNFKIDGHSRYFIRLAPFFCANFFPSAVLSIRLVFCEKTATTEVTASDGKTSVLPPYPVGGLVMTALAIAGCSPKVEFQESENHDDSI